MSAVIFDMDGVIAETESLQMTAFQRTMARKGLTVELKYFHSFVGLSAEDNVRQLNEDFGLDLPVAATVREKNDELMRVIGEMDVKPLPGIAESWTELAARGVPMAVASSSVRRIVDAILGAVFQNASRAEQPVEFFRAIVGGDQASRKKPHPDIYLAASSGLGIEPARCVAIEDSQAGVQSAKAAGMRCIAIPSEFTANHDLSAADHQAETMAEVLAANYFNLIETA